MTVKIFLSPHFKESIPEDKAKILTEQFREYKEEGLRPEIFGRDVPFDFPYQLKQAGLQHIHIKDETSKKWEIRSVFHKTSNTALIYCNGFTHSNYYLI